MPLTLRPEYEVRSTDNTFSPEKLLSRLALTPSLGCPRHILREHGAEAKPATLPSGPDAGRDTVSRLMGAGAGPGPVPVGRQLLAPSLDPGRYQHPRLELGSPPGCDAGWPPHQAPASPPGPHALRERTLPHRRPHGSFCHGSPICPLRCAGLSASVDAPEGQGFPFIHHHSPVCRVSSGTW